MMSRIAPRVQRTSFVSAEGGYWKCMPRNVPFFRFDATLAWAIIGFRPFIAEPMPIPAKPPSEIGVSITRSAPNSSSMPWLTL